MYKYIDLSIDIHIRALQGIADYTHNMSAGAIECTDGIRIRPTIEAGFICWLVSETPGVIIRIIVVIPRKAPFLPARSDREDRLVRTSVEASPRCNGAQRLSFA